MASKLEQIIVPDIEYAGLYFPQIFANLRRINKINVPEITNEDSRELFIQLEKAFALMAHYNNVLLDAVANDMFLRTAKLPESIKLLLELINYKLLPASSAEVDILANLTRTYSSSTTILPANRRVGTKRSSEIPEIIYENSDAIVNANRTDQISEAFMMDQVGTGTCYTYSVYPDIIYYSAGTAWASGDTNKYIRLSGSALGNNTDDLRITEVMESVAGSGTYDMFRVEGGGFVSETGLTFVLSDHLSNTAAALAAAAGVTAIPASLNDKFYFGHSDILFDRADFTFAATIANAHEGRIEFYDPDETYTNPDSVTDLGSQLEFEITTLLGTADCNGALIKMLYLPTGAETNAYSIWSGGVNKVRSPAYLGQSSPSTTATDYYVFCDWRPITITTDNTNNGSYSFEKSGEIIFDLPQSQTDNWQKYTLYENGVGAAEGYYLRYRLVNLDTNPATPVSINFNNGEQYLVYTATQGKTVEDNPLGSSDGTADQQFTLTQTPYIYNSIELYVDEGGGDILWTKVSNLLSSKSYDRHYVLDLQTDGTGVVVFGDGTNGKIPPVGVNNISCNYRIGGDYDGNVGINTITNNIDGANVFKSVTNPRTAKYWIEADWNSQEALEKVKEEAPALVTTMYRATSATDCEKLARTFRTTDNVRPIYRAKAYEESYGPKTVELVVVGPGGTSISTTHKEIVEEYFNGGDTYDGILVVNHELSITNYIPRPIGIQCTVTAYPVVTEAIVLQTLSSLINPTALEIDRVSWTWRFGEEVPLSRIIAEIFNISPGNVFKVDITSPTDDVLLGPRELPTFDVATSNIVIEAP